MGRYDFPCDGSRSDFFNNGVMNAALNCVGNAPAESDLLNSSVTNGASTSAQSLRRRVRIGSAAHCLSGGDDIVDIEGAERRELTVRWSRDERWRSSSGSRCTHSVDLLFKKIDVDLGRRSTTTVERDLDP